MAARLSTEKFIKISDQIHNKKYNYSLVVYKNVKTKVKIICPIHGIFKQTPSLHLNGCGCLKCGYIKRNLKNTYSYDYFIESANKKYNNFYNYSKVKYKNFSTKICIICPIHGEFWQTPRNHVNNKNGCPNCHLNKLHQKLRHNIDIFIKKAQLIHKNKYDYSKAIYINCMTKIEIVCPIHGSFLQTPDNHIRGHQGCPKCKSSKGELKIEQFLIKYNINYKRQHSFYNCKGKKRILLFDFYLPDYNMCIEFDGEQHFNKKNHYYSKQNQIYDNIKSNYCQKNYINLIRIPYWDYNKIDKILLRLI